MGLRTMSSRLEEVAAEACDYLNDLEDRVAVLEMELRARTRQVEETETDLRAARLELAELRADRKDRGPRIVNG